MWKGAGGPEERSRRAEEVSMLFSGVDPARAFRWFAVDVTDVTRSAQLRLNLSPVASVAFGRCVAAAAMLMRMSSKTPRRLILDVRGAGPLGRVMVEVGDGGSVRGLVGDGLATVDGDPRELSVSDALGVGLLRVRREEKRPGHQAPLPSPTPVSYESQVELVSSEIGEDLAYYLQQSEQRRCAVALGVDVGPDGIRRAGGFLVEALPDAPEEGVAEVERHFQSAGPVTGRLERGGLDGLAREIWSDAVVLDRHPMEYRCRCTDEVLRARLESLPASEVAMLADDDGHVRAECAFCGQIYEFGLEDLLEQVPS